MATIQRLAGVETRNVLAGADSVRFGTSGAAIGAITLPAGSGLGGVATLEVFKGDLGGALTDSDGNPATVTLAEGALAILPPGAMVGGELVVTFAAAAIADTKATLLLKT